jgi:hypothetical protein
MSTFFHSGASLEDMLHLNRCRLFLRAYYLSNITTGDGSKLMEEATGGLNVNINRDDTSPRPLKLIGLAGDYIYLGCYLLGGEGLCAHWVHGLDLTLPGYGIFHQKIRHVCLYAGNCGSSIYTSQVLIEFYASSDMNLLFINPLLTCNRRQFILVIRE